MIGSSSTTSDFFQCHELQVLGLINNQDIISTSQRSRIEMERSSVLWFSDIFNALAIILKRLLTELVLGVVLI